MSRLGGLVVEAKDSRSRGCGFEPWCIYCNVLMSLLQCVVVTVFLLQRVVDAVFLLRILVVTVSLL